MSLALFLGATLHYPNAWNRLSRSFYVVVKNMYYMPPSVNDLVLEKLVRRSPISFSFCNKEKRRRLHAG